MPGQRPRRRVLHRDRRRRSWLASVVGYGWEIGFWLVVWVLLSQVWQIGLRTYHLDRQWRSKQTKVARLQKLQRAWDEKRATVQTEEGLELSIREQGYLKPGERWLRFEDITEKPFAREAGTASKRKFPGDETAREMEELLARLREQQAVGGSESRGRR